MVSAADRFHGAKGGPFKKGDPRINPGGKPSVVRDLERARAIGTPPEVAAVLTEWLDFGPARLNEFGPEGFLTGLRAALDEATKRILPVTPEEARAMWWRAILPVAFAGPQGPKDSNWTYAQQEVGVRLLGKPKETIAFEGAETPQINWQKVPPEERGPIGDALLKLQAYLAEPDAAPDNPTEH